MSPLVTKLPYNPKSNPIFILNPNVNRGVILIEGNCLDTSMFLKSCDSRQLFSLGIYFESYCKNPADTIVFLPQIHEHAEGIQI